ncbi:MAG: hypothetical protein ACPGYV_09570 [Phycisphaeraceae bacterium]
MRKPLTASLLTCLVATGLTGCGDKSAEKQVSEQLEELLAKLDQLEYADVPSEGNQLTYTLGAEVDGVTVPGSPTFEAAYIDQALTLLPLAKEIESKGTPLQKQSANAIIGSIRIDEAAYLIDAADYAFQRGAGEIVGLRSNIGVLREIELLDDAVSGDRSETIRVIEEGLRDGSVSIVGTNQLKAESASAASAAETAGKAVADINEKIESLRAQVAEYEALELKLSNEARSSQGGTKFDKMDQATAAARVSQIAQAEAESLELDAWINEQTARLGQLKAERLSGTGSPSDLLAQLDAMLRAAADAVNVSTSSDTYTVLAGELTDAKAAPGGDAQKAAAFLLALSEYVNAGAVDADERTNLFNALNARVNDAIGVIGQLEMKIEQVKIEQRLVADKLAEIEKDRQSVLADFAASFAEQDALIQAAGFARMDAAIASLEEAETAIQGSGNNNALDLMGVYILHARVLHQQSLAAKSYLTTLNSIASVGPEILGGDLHSTLTARAAEMQTRIDNAAASGSELAADAAAPQSQLAGLDPETKAGQVANEQMDIFDNLLAELGDAPATAAPAE